MGCFLMVIILMQRIIQTHWLYGETSLMKNGNKLKNRDLIAHLRECGNFTSLIVKQDLNLEILI